MKFRELDWHNGYAIGQDGRYYLSKEGGRWKGIFRDNALHSMETYTDGNIEKVLQWCQGHHETRVCDAANDILKEWTL